MGDDIVSSFQGIGNELSAIVSECSQAVANWPIYVQVIVGAIVAALVFVMSRTIRDRFRHA